MLQCAFSIFQLLFLSAWVSLQLGIFFLFPPVWVSLRNFAETVFPRVFLFNQRGFRPGCPCMSRLSAPLGNGRNGRNGRKVRSEEVASSCWEQERQQLQSRLEDTLSVSCQHWSALVSTGQLVAEKRSSKGLHLSGRCQAEEAEDSNDYPLVN